MKEELFPFPSLAMKQLNYEQKDGGSWGKGWGINFGALALRTSADESWKSVWQLEEAVAAWA